MTPAEITAYLHRRIPLTRHLGATLQLWDGKTVRLSAPLAPNLNHRNTAFGGSLSALAILGGWTLLHLALRERGIPHRIVIQRSTTDFAEPMKGDFTATSTLPDAARGERFLATLRRHDRARVVVTGSLTTATGLRGTHEGVYVAFRLPEPGVAR